MKKYMPFMLPIVLVLCNYTAHGQSRSYQQQLQRLDKNIHAQFYIDSLGYYKETVQPEKDSRKVSFLWPLCALLQADNEMEKLAGGKDLLSRDFKIIRKYYNQLPPAPGYASYAIEYGGGDRFYDDNQWIGITAMDAFVRTGDKAWLTTGQEIYRFMMTAFDSVAGGGLYWQEGNKRTKNTCSNGPGIILALQLYQATHEQGYLDTALMLYNWVNAKLRSPEGLYYDNIKVENGGIDRRLYSYNTGTMLQANVYLYECTSEKKYLERAVAIADSSVPVFLGNNKFADDYWFCAVLLRGYQHLLKYRSQPKYLQAFRACLDNALANDLNTDGLMGKKHTDNLVGQGGMLEILARYATLSN